MKWLLPFLLLSTLSFGQGLPGKLYFTTGQRMNIDSTYTPWRSFSTNPQFGNKNPLITAQAGDSLACWLVNKDSVAHSFAVEGHAGLWSVNAGDSAWISVALPNAGIFQYHDPTTNQGYLGLSGMLVVNPAPHAFYWNLREYDPTWTDSIIKGNSVNWSQYEPDFFTINGTSAPNINLDTLARVTGNVGDSIHIYISNVGTSIHALHFHGYHATVVSSSKYPNHVGWSKDTFPVYPGETLHLLLVPNQPGEYPVHDHNLVATSGANVYPFGMFTTLLIAP